MRGDEIALPEIPKAGEIILKVGLANSLDAHSRYGRVVPVTGISELADEVWYWLGVGAAKMGGTYDVQFWPWLPLMIEFLYLPEGTTVYERYKDWQSKAVPA